MKNRIFVRTGLTENSLSVPLLVSWNLKWPVGIIVGCSALLIYGASNRLVHSSVHRFKLSWIDQWIPFLPWTVWIYLSGLIYVAVVYTLNRCVVSLNKHLYSFSMLLLTSLILFYFFPTTYPRELYPIPDATPSLTHTLLQFLRSIDSPQNCTPSLHVSIACLVAFGFLEDQRKHFPWIFLWGTLLSLSTLTTKQHYFIDVILGVLLASVFYFLFHRLIPYRFFWNHPEN